jgi:hypothetical protein
MATYVNNLRLKEIATGAESGTWGTSTNTNLELIADALGSGTEAITTNADAHTTTIADGAADEGRALFLKYTGTLDSACTITLAPNTINKVWFIENATSGSQNIIISQGSGANITIGNGKIAVILTDGAGSGAAVLDAFADLELSSTLTVAGAVTMSGDVSVGDDLTLVSDAAVLNFGVNSDVSLTHVHDTGLLLNSTRQLQFSDSSQYINAPSATVLDINATDEIELNATAVDLNGTLDVSGTITLNSDIHVSEYIYHIGDTNTYQRFQADAWTLRTGGTDAISVNSSQDVTIGGDLVVSGTGPHAIGGAVNADAQLTILGSYQGNRALGVFTSLTPNVGEAGTAVSISPTLIEAASGTHAIMVGLYVEACPITTAGGATTTVGSSVYIGGPATGASTNYSLFVASGNISIAPTAKIFLDSGNGTYIAETSGNVIGLVADNNETMRIGVSGVGIKTAPDTEYALKVNGVTLFYEDIYVAAGKKIYLDGGSNTYIVEVSSDLLKWTVSGTDITWLSSSGWYLGAYNGDNQFRTSSAGGGSTTMYIGNQSITTSSDRRLKTDIMDSSLNAVDVLSQLRVTDFGWDDPSDTSFNNRNARGRWTGLIAQEVVEHLPFVVNAPRDEDKVIDHDSDSTWSIEPMALCGVLVKSIQELNNRIKVLESQIPAG